MQFGEFCVESGAVVGKAGFPGHVYFGKTVKTIYQMQKQIGDINFLFECNASDCNSFDK